MTNVHLAATNGELARVRSLVENGADLTTLDRENHTPVHCAVEAGRLAVVRYFVDERGFDVDAQNDDGTTLLHAAAQAGHLEIVRYLVYMQANITACDNEGRTAFFHAARRGHFNILWYFFTKKIADFEHVGGFEYELLEAVLALKAERSYVSLTHPKTERQRRREVQIKLKLAIQCVNGVTCLHTAAAMGDLTAIKYLVQSLRVPTTIEDNSKQPPVFYAAKNRHLDVVRYFVDRNFGHLKSRDAHRATLLHVAAQGGHLRTVGYLVDMYADILADDFEYRSPVFYAVKNGNLDVLRYFLNRKLFHLISRDVDSATLLHVAAQAGHLKVVRYLVSMQADIVARDYKNRTPVHYAAKANNLDVVKYFLDEIIVEQMVTYSLKNSLLRSAVEGSFCSEMLSYLVSERGATLEWTPVAGDWEWDIVKLWYQEWQEHNHY